MRRSTPRRQSGQRNRAGPVLGRRGAAQHSLDHDVLIDGLREEDALDSYMPDDVTRAELDRREVVLR